jgi:hypothetical protein
VFHYKATTAASEEIPLVASLLLKIENDEDLNEEEKLEKVHALLYPESARLGLRHAGQPPPENAELKG